MAGGGALLRHRRHHVRCSLRRGNSAGWGWGDRPVVPTVAATDHGGTPVTDPQAVVGLDHHRKSQKGGFYEEGTPWIVRGAPCRGSLSHTAQRRASGRIGRPLRASHADGHRGPFRMWPGSGPSFPKAGDADVRAAPFPDADGPLHGDPRSGEGTVRCRLHQRAQRWHCDGGPGLRDPGGSAAGPRRLRPPGRAQPGVLRPPGARRKRAAGCGEQAAEPGGDERELRGGRLPRISAQPQDLPLDRRGRRAGVVRV